MTLPPAVGIIDRPLRWEGTQELVRLAPHALTTVHNPLIDVQQALPAATAGASVTGSQHLINSKLKPPLRAAACIERRALVARLDAAFRQKLVLLAAPIGSGKTTLLTQWYRRVAPMHSVAWLSLDERDNDPVRFLSYLTGAVHGAVPRFDAYPTTAMFSESLDRVEQELTIVLDDFQWLTAPELIRTVDFLLYRSPDTVHWIISGRCLPEISLSQLRLADQLLIIDGADLNFEDAHIVQLSRKMCRRALSPEEAASIKTRTEGWVAGTKLALLAAAARPAAAADTLQEFAGSHSEVARYLGASVLHEQSDEIREFLVASCVVDRMTGELCNALLGISHSQSLLERLERLQLFIQPLDSHGHWYRYHTLFLDFLRSVLRRDAARIPVLHERASRWFAEHQLYEEALQHAFLANDPQWRLELVARCLGFWLQEGEIADVLRWSERLPRAEILTHPGISTAYIAALIMSRRFDDATIALREVEARPLHTHLLHAMLTILADSDCHVSIPDAETARLEGADTFLSATVLTLQAYALLRRNQFDLAWRLSMRARDALENVSVYGFGYADVVASLAERAQGDMKSAAERCERMFATVRRGRRNPAWVNAATALACVRYEENRLEEAEGLCREALPLLSVASTVENLTITYLTLARIKAINERFGEAFQLLDYLHSVLESGCHQRFLAQVCREKMRLHLLQNNASRALAIAVEVGLERRAESGCWQQVRPYDEEWERFGFAYTLLLLHRKRTDEARSILTVLRDSARAAGYVYREVALEAALSECAWHAGDQEAAFQALNRGFALTRGYGFTRGVFDDTPALTQIIAAAVESRKLRHLLPERYFCKFGDVFREHPTPAAPRRKSALPLEPLTDREIEILKLVARGLSNPEIGARSRIAVSTAKWHLKNVFAKLDVSTRTGAIARARELQLLD
jgi:LuxR family transcriptional regulator, maltose regulon positive regulatory protein